MNRKWFQAFIRNASYQLFKCEVRQKYHKTVYKRIYGRGGCSGYRPRLFSVGSGNIIGYKSIVGQVKLY
jgi:hypothetical protein